MWCYRIVAPCLFEPTSIAEKTSRGTICYLGIADDDSYPISIAHHAAQQPDSQIRGDA
jgi:hypothetical protein